MEGLTLFNIPNYYSSFYLLGLSKYANLSYQPSKEFKRWNGFPIIILQKGSDLIIIDNADPVCVREELYQKATVYYATNKLIKNQDYNRSKIQPLFPHFPINCWRTYLNTFKQDFFLKLDYKRALKEIYILNKRPSYKKNNRILEKKQGYIFFAGSIWKNEPEANLVRSHFISVCKNLPQIDFEGGLVGRSDGKNFNFDHVASPRKYSPREFSEKSGRSFVGFNNPAVLGAVSWRFAEYLYHSCAVLSLPWEINLPEYPVHGKEIHMIQEKEEIGEVLRFLIKNERYRDKIAKGGKDFFARNCDPLVQASRILST